MVACAHSDAFPVEHLRDVVRVDVVEGERDDARPAVGRRPEQPDVRYVRELLECVGGEVVLVLLDRFQAGSVEVVDGSAEADRLGQQPAGAGLELVGQVAPGRPVGLADDAPPTRNGSIRSRSSDRPQTAPIPLGPHILCPETARKSQPIACTSPSARVPSSG